MKVSFPFNLICTAHDEIVALGHAGGLAPLGLFYFREVSEPWPSALLAQWIFARKQKWGLGPAPEQACSCAITLQAVPVELVQVPQVHRVSG